VVLPDQTDLQPSSARGHDYSLTVKLTVLLGGYLSNRYNHHYYAKAQNLGRRLRERYDVLMMPTTAMTARSIPAEPSIPTSWLRRSATSTTRRPSTSPATPRSACRAACPAGIRSA